MTSTQNIYDTLRPKHHGDSQPQMVPPVMEDIIQQCCVAEHCDENASATLKRHCENWLKGWDATADALNPELPGTQDPTGGRMLQFDSALEKRYAGQGAGSSEERRRHQ